MSSGGNGWSRRDFLKASGLAAGGAMLLPALGCAADAMGPRNVVLITGDDQGWKDLSAAGNPNVKTPNLDRLQRGGVSFTHAFDATSTCSSSRATYATGRYPHTHGVTALVHRVPEVSLPKGTPTLASHLRKAGLVTAIEGKWHLAFPAPPDDFGYQDVMTSFGTQWILDSSQSIDFIERRAHQRFYYELNYMNPHRNLLGNFEQHPDHPVDPGAIEIPDYVHLPDVPGAREELAAYYSQVERMDELIGEVLDALETAGLLEDTLITFISDNGIPFPGNKLNLYDRGTGTPWIFHWPAGLESGVVRDDLVSSVDLMPTLLEMVGLSVPAEVQGKSLVPLLLGIEDASGESAVFSEMTAHEDLDAPFPMRSVRTDRYRYIRNHSDAPIPIEGAGQDWVEEVLAMALPGYLWNRPRVPEELYDLSVDPQEQVNLAGDASAGDVLADLRERLDQHMSRTADPLLGQPFETTASLKR